MLCREHQQEAVREAPGRRCRAELPRTNRSLGRPSVGGRLLAGGARNEYKSKSVICPVGSVELFMNAIQFRSTWAGRTVRAEALPSLIGSACRAVSRTPRAAKPSSLCKLSVRCCSRPCGVPQRQSHWPVLAPASTPARVALERSGCQNATCTRRRHLTRRSSGRSKACCARFSPPLISNVRSH